LAVDLAVETHARLAEELRQRFHLWYSAVFRAMRALLTGALEEGERLAQQALVLGQQTQPQPSRQAFSIQMFQLCKERGQLQVLEEAVKTLIRKNPTFPVWRCGLANLYSEVGRKAEAQSEFECLAANDFTALPRDMNWLIGVALLAETCAFLEDSRAAVTLYELLLPYARRNIVVGPGIACFGSAAYYLGLLATTLERWEEAQEHFEAALQRHMQMGAQSFVAHTQYDYARMLLARNQPGDQGKAQEFLVQALTTAQELGMKGLEDKIQSLKSKVQDLEFQAQGSRFNVQRSGARSQEPETNTSTLLPSNSEPLAPNSVLSPRSSVLPTPNTQHLAPNLFRHEGDYWTIAYEGMVVRLKDSNGLRYLAQLLRHPDREFHVLDLITAGAADQAPTGRDAGELAHLGLQAGGLGDAGEILDPQARAAYKRRLTELREELEEAQEFNDLERAERLQQEIDFLTQELANAVGLGGRNRKAASQAERARVNITRAIKAVIKKVAEQHPALERYFATTIKTGTFCSYTPDTRFSVTWQF